MKNLHLALLALLVAPQANQCMGSAIGAYMTAAAATSAACVAMVGYGAYRVGKKTYNYIKLTPDTCKDADTQIKALINNPEAHTKELEQLFNTLNRCHKKFGK